MPMELSPEAADYLDYGPVGAGRLQIAPDEFAQRTLAARELPDNLQRIYFDPSTAGWIRELVTTKRLLADEQAQELAALLGHILRGELGADALQTAIRQRLGTTAAVAEALARDVTQKFIAPNYFQITKVYARRQQTKGVGSREPHFAEASRGRQVVGTTSTEPTPRDTVAPAASSMPPRVVDLRNGSIPSRLPPAPMPVSRPQPTLRPFVSPRQIAPPPTSPAAAPSPPARPAAPSPRSTPTPSAPTPPTPSPAPASSQPPAPSAPPRPTPPPPPPSPQKSLQPGKPLEDLTVKSPPTSPLSPRTPRPSPPPMRPAAGSGTHGPLPPPKAV